MQTDYKQIYKMAADKTGKDEQFYKDLGNFIFSEVYKMQRKPHSLIIKLKGVGSWHLRKKRMEHTVNNYPERGMIKDRSEYATDQEYNEQLDRKEVYDLFVERLKDYEEYLQMKKEVREKRYETQVLLRPSDRED